MAIDYKKRARECVDEELAGKVRSSALGALGAPL